MAALEQQGHRLSPVDTLPGDLAARHRALGWRVKRRLFGDRDDSRLNERLLALGAHPAPDLVWVDKGLTVTPSTLRALQGRWPHAVFVHYSGDDMFNPHNQTAAWRAGVPLYHLHATTKSFNVPELLPPGRAMRCSWTRATAPLVHRPHAVTPELRARFGGDVGFVGWPEGARERSMRHLARHGIDVRVWGPWPRRKSAPHLLVEGRPLWDAEYAMALSAFRINLGFLRHVNRDGTPRAASRSRRAAASCSPSARPSTAAVPRGRGGRVLRGRRRAAGEGALVPRARGRARAHRRRGPAPLRRERLLQRRAVGIILRRALELPARRGLRADSGGGPPGTWDRLDRRSGTTGSIWLHVTESPADIQPNAATPPRRASPSGAGYGGSIRRSTTSGFHVGPTGFACAKPAGTGI